MRIFDGRGIEYEVTYDAERGWYVYFKVFKPSEAALGAGEPAPHMSQEQVQSSPS